MLTSFAISVLVASSGRASSEDEVDARESLVIINVGIEVEAVEGKWGLARGAGAEKLVAMKSAKMRSRWIFPIVCLSLIGRCLGAGSQ